MPTLMHDLSKWNKIAVTVLYRENPSLVGPIFFSVTHSTKMVNVTHTFDQNGEKYDTKGYTIENTKVSLR